MASSPRNTFATIAVTVISLMAISFFASVTRQMTRRAWEGDRHQPARAPSRYPPAPALPSVRDAAHRFAIGGVQLTATPPDGFVLLTDDAALAQIPHPPDTQLHLVFVTAADAARAANGDAPVLDRFVTIQSNRLLDAHFITAALFQDVKSMTRDQGFEGTLEDNKAVVNRWLSDAGRPVVDEVKVVGFTETADSYTLTSLVKPRDHNLRVSTVTVRNMRGRCIFVSAAATCRDEDDIAWTTATAEQCARNVK